LLVGIFVYDVTVKCGRFRTGSFKMRMCGFAEFRSGKIRRNSADIICVCYE